MYRVSVFLLIYFSFAAQAGDTITVVSGISKPPYVIQKDNSGFEIDLIRNVIKTMRKSAKFMYVNYGRSSKLLYTEDVDAVMTTNNLVFIDQSILSDPYISYHNVAITLAENDFQIDNISDLSRYSIVSFQLANKVLGQAFAEAAQNSPMYIQMGRQSRQPEMLFKKTC